jgi:hypothetical protein
MSAQANVQENLVNEQWAVHLGGSLGDGASAVQQTTDGGYIVAGYTGSYGAGSLDLWAIKLNPDGSIAWQKTYGANQYEFANSIQETVDGGYIIAGVRQYYPMNDGVWLLKIDSQGAVQWQKTYEFYGYPQTVQQTSDEGFIVAGNTSSSIWAMKLDANGNTVWNKFFSGANGESFPSVQETSDGGYIVLGETFSFGEGNVWVLKLNSEGSIT